MIFHIKKKIKILALDRWQWFDFPDYWICKHLKIFYSGLSY